MNAVELDNIRYRFPDTALDALAAVDWQVEPGTLSLVTGQSGSGKTTLLRVLNGLVPHLHGGRFGGRAVIFGLDTRAHGPGRLSGLVGTVFQDPEAQCVTDTAGDELVFGMEQRGLPRAEMRRRVAEVSEQLGIAHLLDRSLDTLSGGERQRVVLAAVLALQPRLLVLDEPTSQLDPAGAVAFLDALDNLDGATTVIAEHRLERLLPPADQLACVRDGRLEAGPARRMVDRLDDPPPLIELGRRLGWDPLPLSVEEAGSFLNELPVLRSAVPSRSPMPGNPLLAVTQLTVTVGDAFKLDGLSFTLYEGELVALIGPNGSGKTSLLRALLGLLALDQGTVRAQGQDLAGVPVAQRARLIGYVPQHATSILHQETLAGELAFSLRVQGKRGDIDATLTELGIDRYRDRHPLDLSGGERQRAALAALAVTEPRVLLLDEPTRGLPAAEKSRLGGYLRRYTARGRATLVVTHDAEFVARQADRVLLLEAGRLIADGPPAEVLPINPHYRPQLSRLFGGDILGVDDLVTEIGAEPRISAAPALTPNHGA